MEEQQQLIHALETREVITQAVDDIVFKNLIASEKWVDVQDKVVIETMKTIRDKVWAEYPNLDLKFLVADCNEIDPEPSKTEVIGIPGKENPSMDEVARDIENDLAPPPTDQVKDSAPPLAQPSRKFLVQQISELPPSIIEQSKDQSYKLLISEEILVACMGLDKV